MVEQRVRKVSDPFQWRIFVRILSYGLIYQVTVWNLLFCWRLVHGQGSFLDQYREFFAEQYPILLCVLVLAPAFAWDAVKFCHRVAGPIYRFRVTVKDIAADRPVNLVRLRTGDELLGLRDDFNEMLTALAARNAIDLVTSDSTRLVEQQETSDRGGDLVEPTSAR